jgi:hypothetical protein
MTPSQHTPAPWKLNKKAPLVYAGEGKEVLTLIAATDVPTGMPAHEPSFEERFANARLIAAAPELLAALELVARTVGNPYGKYSDFEDIMFAAINKAKGK